MRLAGNYWNESSRSVFTKRLDGLNAYRRIEKRSGIIPNTIGIAAAPVPSPAQRDPEREERFESGVSP